MRRLTGLLLAGLLLLAGCAPASSTESESAGVPTPTQPPAAPTPTSSQAARYQNPGDYLDELPINGVLRAFVLHVPASYDSSQPAPLVFNIHGAGSNAIAQERASQWHAKADEFGFIVVAPQALGNPPVWMGVFLDQQGDADMGFFRALLDQLNRELNIDPDRIYATGLSNGGTMVNRLGCDLSQSFAAIAPVSGAQSGLHLCENQRPVSVLAIHGTDDRIIPYLGNGSDVPSVRTWVEAWAVRDGCDEVSAESQLYEQVRREGWSGCDQGTEVALLTVEGGGHGWLGMEYIWDGITFDTSVGATDVIWDFFAAHARSSSP